MPPYFTALVLVSLAWGLFAFGAVYDWAYTPLGIACCALGLLGLWAPGFPARNRVHSGLAAGLAAILLATLVQLVPLRPTTIESTSQTTARFLERYNVGYSLALAGTKGSESGQAEARSFRHPLSINPAGTMLGAGCLVAFGLLMLGTARAMGRSSLKTLAAGLAILGFALALAGIIQSGLYTRDPNPTVKVYGLWEPLNTGTLPFGPFINRNHFAGAMLLLMPLALGHFAGLVSRGMRGVKPTLRDRIVWFSSADASRVILVGLAVGVMGLSLVLTLSRSGIAGFFVALALALTLVMRRQSSASRRGVSVVYIALLSTLAIGWAGFDAIVGRFSSASGDFFGGRLIAWTDTWKIVRDFPLVGTGLNTYGYATLFYQTPDLPRHYVEAHNDYLQLLAEGGLLLAIPAVITIFLLAREIHRRFTEGQDDSMTYWLRVGATTGLVAIGLQEIVEFSLQIPGIAALVAVVAAIAIHRPPPRRELSGDGVGRDNAVSAWPPASVVRRPRR